MFATLRRTIRDWRVQRIARHAFQRQLGFARHPWPVSVTMTMEERRALVDVVEQWLREQLAETATPYGVSQYGVLLRLAEVTTRRQVLWTFCSPTFCRQDASRVWETLREQLVQLPLIAYPTATHVEAHLVSLGDILTAADA